MSTSRVRKSKKIQVTKKISIPNLMMTAPFSRAIHFRLPQDPPQWSRYIVLTETSRGIEVVFGQEDGTKVQATPLHTSKPAALVLLKLLLEWAKEHADEVDVGDAPDLQERQP